MPVKLIDGKKIADKILDDIFKKLISKKAKPDLACILIGNNKASKMYLKIKEKACLKAGINFHSYQLDKDCPEEKIIEVINFLNNDPDVTGILIQLPLPVKLKTNKLINAIKPEKDIDGFQANSKFTSPTVQGIIELLKSTKEELSNKKIIILSNSAEFAKPFNKLLNKSKIYHIKPTDNKLADKLQDADILIVAIGKPNFLKPNMIKKGVILIDVGITKIKNKTIGDIDPKCDKIAAFRSPVPGGVGPMTVAMLLKNLIK